MRIGIGAKGGQGRDVLGYFHLHVMTHYSNLTLTTSNINLLTILFLEMQ